jgi:hypothetical protein
VLVYGREVCWHRWQGWTEREGCGEGRGIHGRYFTAHAKAGAGVTHEVFQMIVGVHTAQTIFLGGMCFVLQICRTRDINSGCPEEIPSPLYIISWSTFLVCALKNQFWKSVLGYQICFTSYVADALRGRVGAPTGGPRKRLQWGQS